MKNQEISEILSAEKIKRRTFISFIGFGVAAATGITAWRWYRALPATEGGLSSVTRNAFHFNERVNARFFSQQHLAPLYDKRLALANPRSNGTYGVTSPIDISTWQLEIVHPVTEKSIFLTLDDLKKLPKQELVFDFKCIEGWNEIVHYGGVKLADVLAQQQLGLKSNGKDFYEFVGMETPDKEYYVGLDIKSAMHPQTLLCYELNGLPLPMSHGAPLRLVIPVKYGVKNIKRIGKIFFADARPRDYWHENGYDYDAAL